MRTTYLPFFGVIFISILMAAHLIFRSPDFPFSVDSASYIEQARNLIQEGSALINPYGLNGIDKMPDHLFPIGFPILLAFISLFGLDPREAALTVGWLSAILLPLLLYISFRRQIGSSSAAILAGLSTLSPGVLNNAPMGLTDVFALAIAITAIGLVLNARSTTLFFVSGAIAGFSYAVRNANIALLLALAVYFLYLWLSNPAQQAITTRRLLAFLAGVSLVILPLFLRNIMIFGSPNPYIMEPSTIGIITNVRMYIVELIYDLTALWSLGDYIGWSIPGLILLLVSSIGASLLIMIIWGHLTENRRKTIFLCTTYSIIGTCVVIAARSRYEWGEPINIRHTLQYTPFFLAAILAAIPEASSDVFLSRIRKGGVIFVLALGLFHLLYSIKPKEYERRTHHDYYAMNAYQNGEGYLCASEENMVFVSNWAFVFRILCSTGVRHIAIDNLKFSTPKSSFSGTMEPSNALVNIVLDLSNRFKGKPIRVGFYPDQSGLKFINLLPDKVDVITLQTAGWTIVQHDDKGLLLTHQ